MKWTNPRHSRSNRGGARAFVLAALAAAILAPARDACAQPQRPPPEQAALDQTAPTPPDAIQVAPGFKVDLIHAAAPNEGSWIFMTVDPQGRLIISAERQSDLLLRMTITNGAVSQIERARFGVRGSMGLLCLTDAMYFDGNGRYGWGIYKSQINGQQFTQPAPLCLLGAESEHGEHAVIMGPDNKLYVTCGDWTYEPRNVDPLSPYRNFQDDQLLPRPPDSRGFSSGSGPPQGFIFRMNTDGSDLQLFAASIRNIYQIAFNDDGELFGADNDMEWDIGSTWYRPNRVLHLISGGDYGHHQGAGKFPMYYEDTLPSAVGLGMGSPAGFTFAPTNCAFPPQYRGAAFVEDWTYGRLFAVHFTPHGATYDAASEVILRGKPLNMSCLAFMPDGNLYFITGGRKIQSGLYRLSYVGPKVAETPTTAAQAAAEQQGAAARALRHKLEAMAAQSDPALVPQIWPSLGSDDRWIRWAARLALESQPLPAWQGQALAEKEPFAGLTALMALTRYGGPLAQHDLLLALDKFPFDQLTPEQRLIKLRVIELSFIRQGRPEASLEQHEIDQLDPLYPADSEPVNLELSQLLLYLNAPDAVHKTLDLLDKAPMQEEQIYYVMRLRTISQGWTLADRRRYFAWFNKSRENLPHPAAVVQAYKDIDLDYSDGLSIQPFLDNFKQEALATMSDADRAALADVISPPTPPPAASGTVAWPVTNAVPAKFVKNWKVADLAPDLDRLKSGRSFTNGMAMFARAACMLCHRFQNEGGSVGPDLTAVSSRLSSHDILESILDPSKVLPEQYANTILSLKDGDDMVGRVLSEDSQKIVLMTDLIHGVKVDVLKSDVESRRLSKVSPMPEELLNSMTEEQIWDLIAFVQSGGKSNYAAFRAGSN